MHMLVNTACPRAPQDDAHSTRMQLKHKWGIRGRRARVGSSDRQAHHLVVVALPAVEDEHLDVGWDNAPTFLALPALDASLEVLDGVRGVDFDPELPLLPLQTIEDSHLLLRMPVRRRPI